MKRVFLPVFLLVVMVLMLTSGRGATAEGDAFQPTWREGDQWTVKAIYALQPEPEKWSRPMFWRYTVLGNVTQEDQECLIVEIRELDRDQDPVTRLAYRTAEFSLVSADILKKRLSGYSLRRLHYAKGAPVKTEQSLTPYDTPVFPLVIPSAAEFQVCKPVGDLTIISQVRQVVRSVAAPGTALPGIDREMIEVRCSDAHGQWFLQYWDTGFPWPLYGENNHCRYWLVIE